MLACAPGTPTRPARRGAAGPGARARGGSAAGSFCEYMGHECLKVKSCGRLISGTGSRIRRHPARSIGTLSARNARSVPIEWRHLMRCSNLVSDASVSPRCRWRPGRLSSTVRRVCRAAPRGACRAARSARRGRFALVRVLNRVRPSPARKQRGGKAGWPRYADADMRSRCVARRWWDRRAEARRTAIT